MTILAHFNSIISKENSKQGFIARYVFMFCVAYVISEITLYNIFLIDTILIAFLFREKNSFGATCSIASDVRTTANIFTIPTIF